MMETINKYFSRTLGLLTVLLLAAFVSGCLHDDDDSSPDPVVTDPVVTDPAALTVTVTSPTKEATDVSRNSSVTATFSEAMNDTTIDGTSFTVEGAGAAVVGEVTLDAASNTAIFNPNSKFSSTIDYTATITTAAKSTAGTALASDYVWTFTSSTTTDGTAPKTTSTRPADGSTGVILSRSISVDFDEALDPATVNSDSFTLTSDDGATSVAGTVIVNRVVQVSRFMRHTY